ELADVLARTVGWARYVYNWALRLRTDAYDERHERLGSHEASAALPTLKQLPETAWLNDVCSVPRQQALGHVDTAFRTCFEGRAKYPTFDTVGELESPACKLARGAGNPPHPGMSHE